jgi:hypothetical protein
MSGECIPNFFPPVIIAVGYDKSLIRTGDSSYKIVSEVEEDILLENISCAEALEILNGTEK